jgi:hypothetical protein
MYAELFQKLSGMYVVNLLNECLMLEEKPANYLEACIFFLRQSFNFTNPFAVCINGAENYSVIKSKEKP